MRITPALLHRIAREVAAQRSRQDRSLLAVFLSGSLVEGDPLLGGTTDIDLFFIHHDEIEPKREIERLTDEVHLDIAHHSRDEYRQARALRLHPWMGYNIIYCIILFDPQHFLHFTQASVRAQFDLPEYVLGRARGQAEQARSTWLQLHDFTGEPGLPQVQRYLDAVGQAANAIACLSGLPLTERRFLLRFPVRAEAVSHPGLYPGLLGLLGGPQVDGATLSGWLPAWEAAYLSLSPSDAVPRLDPHRCPYFRRAFASIVSSETPQNLLWPLLRTWTDVVERLPDDSLERQTWENAMAQLGLFGPGFREKVAALDVYLDSVEEILDEWGQARGIEETRFT